MHFSYHLSNQKLCFRAFTNLNQAIVYSSCLINLTALMFISLKPNVSRLFQCNLTNNSSCPFDFHSDVNHYLAIISIFVISVLILNPNSSGLILVLTSSILVQLLGLSFLF